MRAWKWVVCVLALVASGCSNSTSQSTTAPTVIVTYETDFAGTLAVGATARSPLFTVAGAGTAAIDLESVTLTDGGPATTIQLGIGLIPATTDASGNTVCTNTTSSMTTAPGLTAQLTASVTAGSYCASVYDPGTLTAPVFFLVRIQHP